MAGQIPGTRPNRGKDKAQAHCHFPVITGGRPFLVVLPSPPICCSLLAAQGATLFPRRLPVMSNWWWGTDGRVGSGQRRMMVSLAQRGMCWWLYLNRHAINSLRCQEGAMCVSPPQASGARGQGQFPTLATSQPNRLQSTFTESALQSRSKQWLDPKG